MSIDLWQRGCERLASELPEQQFNTWIRPLPDALVTEQGADAALVSLRVPNRFKLDWIRNQYAGRIEAVLSELAGKPVRLELTLAPREAVAATKPPGAPNGVAVHAAGGFEMPARPAAPPADAQPSRHRLNPALTFDTLVPGRDFGKPRIRPKMPFPVNELRPLPLPTSGAGHASANCG